AGVAGVLGSVVVVEPTRADRSWLTRVERSRLKSAPLATRVALLFGSAVVATVPLVVARLVPTKFEAFVLLKSRLLFIAARIGSNCCMSFCRFAINAVKSVDPKLVPTPFVNHGPIQFVNPGKPGLTGEAGRP